MVMMSDKDDMDNGAVPPSVAQQIDENLKRLYDDAASETLPKTLTDLLEALRKQDGRERSDDA